MIQKTAGRPRLLELLRVAARFYHETLYRERDGAAAREYLEWAPYNKADGYSVRIRSCAR